MAVAALMLVWAAPGFATTYYVRKDGANSPTCNGQSNASSASAPNCAWLTIDSASDNSSVNAGDTVRIQAGTYAESVSPSRNGTLGSPVTFVADGAVTFCTLALSNGDQYLRFVNVNIDTDAGGCTRASIAGVTSW